jgi:hypothetical protein
MNQIMRQILGGVIVLTGLVGIGFGIYALVWVQETTVEVERDLISAMDAGLEGLEVISDTLVVVVQTVDDVGAVLESVAASSQHAAGTIGTMQDAVREMGDVVAVDLPQDIERIQGTMPALEQASAAIDRTLRTLADFQWRATIPIINYTLDLGLGIEYDPPVPLDQSVTELDAALGRLPDQLAGIQTSLLATDQGLGDTAGSMEAIGDSLAAVKEDLNATAEVLAQYGELVAGATHEARRIRRDLRDRIDGVRLTLSGVLVWLVISQLAPLYLGATMLAVKRPAKTEAR